uniref:Uncharacterized protein n=1 Tax=Glossina brevipalpis TaxID=37001 RepID=A0A1A9WT68_9MUSC
MCSSFNLARLQYAKTDLPKWYSANSSNEIEVTICELISKEICQVQKVLFDDCEYLKRNGSPQKNKKNFCYSQRCMWTVTHILGSYPDSRRCPIYNSCNANSPAASVGLVDLPSPNSLPSEKDLGRVLVIYFTTRAAMCEWEMFAAMDLNGTWEGLRLYTLRPGLRCMDGKCSQQYLFTMALHCAFNDFLATPQDVERATFISLYLKTLEKTEKSSASAYKYAFNKQEAVTYNLVMRGLTSYMLGKPEAFLTRCSLSTQDQKIKYNEKERKIYGLNNCFCILIKISILIGLAALTSGNHNISSFIDNYFQCRLRKPGNENWANV